MGSTFPGLCSLNKFESFLGESFYGGIGSIGSRGQQQ
jgi:hypothetical protein